MRTIGLCLGVLAGVWLTGCASFAGKAPPSYSYDQIPPVEQKWAVSYDATFVPWSGQEYTPSTRSLHQEVRKVFSRSGVFSTVEAPREPGGTHLSIEMAVKTRAGWAALSGVVSAATLFLIPGFERDHFTLTVDVRRGAELLKRYVYKDYTDIWYQLFLIPWTPTHLPNDVDRELMDHMLLKFVHDLSADRLLEEKREAPGAAEGAPGPVFGAEEKDF